MEKQSVRIGVDRFFYAMIESEDDTGITYQDELPVHLPGVNAIALNVNSAIGSFYADDGIFETYQTEGDYDIQVKFAGISNEVASKLTGATYERGLLVDKKNDTSPYMAIGFRTQKSNGEYRYVWIYKGRFTKPDMQGFTKSNSISPQSDVYSFKAVSRLSDGAWRQMLDSDDAEIINKMTNSELNNPSTGWFCDPNFVPSLSEPEE